MEAFITDLFMKRVYILQVMGMQFANGVHASYGRDMSASIKVFVK